MANDKEKSTIKSIVNFLTRDGVSFRDFKENPDIETYRKETMNIRYSGVQDGRKNMAADLSNLKSDLRKAIKEAKKKSYNGEDK